MLCFLLSSRRLVSVQGRKEVCSEGWEGASPPWVEGVSCTALGHVGPSGNIILLPGTWEIPRAFSLYNSLSSPFMGYSIFGICVIFHNKKGLKTLINLIETNYTYKAFEEALEACKQPPSQC